jgi:hypothetical protein
MAQTAVLRARRPLSVATSLFAQAMLEWSNTLSDLVDLRVSFFGAR